MGRNIRFVVVVALLFALLAVASAVYAQGPGRGGRGRFGGFGLAAEFRGLDLTEAQQQQIDQITQQYREQVLAVLTPEQQERVRQRRLAQETRMKERLDRLQQRRQQQQQ